MSRQRVIAQVAEVVLDRRHTDDRSMLAEVQATLGDTDEAQMAELLLMCAIFLREELDAVEPGLGAAMLRRVRDHNRRLVAAF